MLLCLTILVSFNIILSMAKKIFKLKISPSVQILFGFLGVILIGSFLLSLPISNEDGKWFNFIDSLFTSTSAVCVTGLVVVDTATKFTLFGELVIMFLIQIGGLGIIAVTSLFFMIFRKKISLSSSLTIKESLNKETIQGVVKFIKKTIIITLIIELVGALLLLFGTISFTHDFWKGLYFAIFLSISSFCNAGFDVLGEDVGEFVSLSPFSSSILMLLPIMMLIVLGGIGFVVMSDIFNGLKNKQHSKVVLIMTSLLLIVGTILFAIFEWNNNDTLGNMSTGDKILNSIFQSVSTRTAGISTINQGGLTGGGYFLTIFLMCVGAGPNSTAGGLKVTTLFILLLFMFKLPNSEGDIRLRNRKVSRRIVMKAIRIILYYFIVLLFGVILISIFEPNIIGLDCIFYECVSALSTVGLTMGITPLLSVGSKIVLMFLMFIGRVGLTTIAMVIVSRGMSLQKQEIEFSNTDIIIG